MPKCNKNYKLSNLILLFHKTQPKSLKLRSLNLSTYSVQQISAAIDLLPCEYSTVDATCYDQYSTDMLPLTVQKLQTRERTYGEVLRDLGRLAQTNGVPTFLFKIDWVG